MFIDLTILLTSYGSKTVKFEFWLLTVAWTSEKFEVYQEDMPSCQPA